MSEQAVTATSPTPMSRAAFDRDAARLIRGCDIELAALDVLMGEFGAAIDRIGEVTQDAPHRAVVPVASLRLRRREARTIANRVSLCRNALIQVRREVDRV